MDMQALVNHPLSRRSLIGTCRDKVKIAVEKSHHIRKSYTTQGLNLILVVALEMPSLLCPF